MGLIDEFEALKSGKLSYRQIDDLTDEMKWYLVKSDEPTGFKRDYPLMSDDMLRYLIVNGETPGYVTTKNVDDLYKRIVNLNITEDEWVQGIKKCKITWISPEYPYMILKSGVTITNKMALEICKRMPLFIKEDRINSVLSYNDKIAISQAYTNMLKNGVRLPFQLPKILPLTDDQWRQLQNQNDIRYQKSFLQREDMPTDIKRELLKEMNYIDDFGNNLSENDIIFWLHHHKNDDEYYIEKAVNYHIPTTMLPNITKACIWIFPLLKKKTAKVCQIAVEIDPSNIRFVKRPSDKLRVLAVTKDPSTKQYLDKITPAVLKILGENLDIETENAKINKYPNDYYLVQFHEDLCDEGYLHCIKIVEGKNMEDFMRSTFTVSFGNMDDNETRNVSDCATIMPITKEERDILEKLNLTHIESGFFDFSK